MNKGMNMKYRLIGVLLALLCGMTACVARPVEESGTEWQGKELFEPAGEMEGSVLDLNARYETYSENMALAFVQNQPTDGGAFETETYEDGVKITAYTGSENVVVVPETISGKQVLALGESSFADSSVRAVKVPDCVRVIEKGAFASCDNLVTLAVPFVGDGGENTHFGYIFGADSYENHPLSVPVSLDMVLLGNGVERIEENAFAGCKSLSAVCLPDSVTEIADFAFYECKDLVYITPTNAVHSVGNYAFGYCTSLFMAYFDEVQHFGLGAFYGCSSLRILSLPFVGGTATENRFIGYLFGAESADYNAAFVPKSLYSVIVSDADEIPDRAFAGCAYVAKFLLEDGAKSIGVRAFYGCRSIVEISLPDSVKQIGNDAFFGCDNMQKIDLGDSLESIGSQAFLGCRALSSVTIPDGVSELLPSTFAYCKALVKVELSAVKKIGKDAFYGCESLEPPAIAGAEVADGNEALFGGEGVEE